MHPLYSQLPQQYAVPNVVQQAPIVNVAPTLDHFGGNTLAFTNAIQSYFGNNFTAIYDHVKATLIKSTKS